MHDRMRRGALREYVGGALWVLPAAAVVVALVAGFLLSQVELDRDSVLGRMAFQGSAEDARQLLIVVSATMITVTGLVFTVTIVALQIASTQFSPRLLRNFLRDRGNQWVLGVFVSTFAYSLAGLHTVGSPTGADQPFVPRLAVSGSLVLAFASVGMLVYFIHHIAHSIQIDTIMAGVERETLHVIAAEEPAGSAWEDVGEPDDLDRALPLVPERAGDVVARRSGYVQAVDAEVLLALAVRHGLSVRLAVAVGDHIVAGSVLAWTWSDSPADPVPPGVRDRVRDLVTIGFERTMQQDIAFGLRRLVDIALRAISPAINDPYTAVQAVQHLTVILCTLAPLPLGHHLGHGPDGAVRVAIPFPRFADYLQLACAEIRRFGGGEPRVAQALLRLLAEVGRRVGSAARREEVAEQVRLVVAAAEAGTAQEADRMLVRVDAADVLEAEVRGP